ncbi:MAG: hypothetical protein Q9195_004276, partial [Heterodermia aff. obscurata]
MVLQPPSERDYASLENLIQVVQAHALNKGYAVRIKRSKTSYFSNEKRKCVLICDREDAFKRKAEAIVKKFKKTDSKKCG